MGKLLKSISPSHMPSFTTVPTFTKQRLLATGDQEHLNYRSSSLQDHNAVRLETQRLDRPTGHSLTDATLTCSIVVIQLSSVLSFLPTRCEWFAEGLLLCCTLSTHPVTLNRWKILRPKGACVHSCGICQDIFSVTHPSCGCSSHPHVLSSVGFSPDASVAKLNIDSELMAQQTVLPTRT